jgi:hypothetical protein
MGLLELYDVQGGAKLKHLGSQTARHFILAYLHNLMCFSLKRRAWFVAFYFTSVQTRNEAGFLGFFAPVQFCVTLS